MVRTSSVVHLKRAAYATLHCFISNLRLKVVGSVLCEVVGDDVGLSARTKWQPPENITTPFSGLDVSRTQPRSVCRRTCILTEVVSRLKINGYFLELLKDNQSELLAPRINQQHGSKLTKNVKMMHAKNNESATDLVNERSQVHERTFALNTTKRKFVDYAQWVMCLNHILTAPMVQQVPLSFLSRKFDKSNASMAKT